MIKGIAKMEFGTGDILMTAALSHDVGALCCITQEPHAIGERVPNGKGWCPDEAQVILTFTKPESIDSMIAELQLVRSMMDGSYDFNKGTFNKHDIDFDKFMHKENNINYRERLDQPCSSDLPRCTKTCQMTNDIEKLKQDLINQKKDINDQIVLDETFKIKNEYLFNKESYKKLKISLSNQQGKIELAPLSEEFKTECWNEKVDICCDDCKYLNITEAQQQIFKTTDHRCTKHNIRLFHRVTDTKILHEHVYPYCACNGKDFEGRKAEEK